MFDPERTGEQTVAPPPESFLDHDPLQIDPDESVPARPGAGPRGPRGPRQRQDLPAWIRQRGVVVTVAVLATVLVAGLLAWNGGRSGDDATAAASHPATSPSAGRSGLPTASDGPISEATFEPLTGTSPAPVALLTARGARGALVPLDAGFRLESRDDTPASALAARLSVDPAFAFTTAKEAGDHAVLLTPARPLTAGSVYRFALRGEAGQLLDTWAFQAKQPLRIVGTLPEARSADVPVDTRIEITFDQDGVTDAEPHLSIEPATAGRFEQHGRTLSFIPSSPLAPSTVYSVTVTRGIAVAATGEETVVDTRF